VPLARRGVLQPAPAYAMSYGVAGGGRYKTGSDCRAGIPACRLASGSACPTARFVRVANPTIFV
jgi:hypothetical protein